MSYIATVQHQSYTIDLQRQNHQAQVRLNDQPHTLDWRKVAPLIAGGAGQRGEEGRYSLLINGHSYDIFARRLPSGGNQEQTRYEIWVGGERFEVAVEDERTHLLSGIAQSNLSSAADVQAPMPGLVVAVLVEPGSSVAQDQPVVILEAMKMENDLPAPIAGTVREVRVSKGQTVDQGDILIVIDGTTS